MIITAKRSLHLQKAQPVDSRPMAELNITPLIDVLLVLLVMLMLSEPPRDCRRLFGLSYAATGVSSSVA